MGTGLDHLQSLKCLYLHENRIEEISVSRRFKFLLTQYHTFFKGFSILILFTRVPILLIIQGSLKVGCPVKPESVEQLHHSPAPTLLSAQSSHAQHRQVGNLKLPKRKAFEGIICSNRLQTGDDVRELSSCNSLSVLDLSHNLLEDPEVHFAFFCETQ